MRESGRAQNGKGFYSEYPAATPKYAAAQSFTAAPTIARLLISLPNAKVRERYISSLPAPARALARQLAGVHGKSGGRGYIDFFLTQAQESFTEKMQVVETLADNFVAYFYGNKAPVFQYAGNLLNTYQDDWRSAFTVLYLNVLRGTQLARHGVEVSLAYDNTVVTGSLFGLTQSINGSREMASDFSFQFLVRRMDVFRLYNSRPSRTPHSADYSRISNRASTFGRTLGGDGGVQRDVRAVVAPRYVSGESSAAASKEEDTSIEATMPGDKSPEDIAKIEKVQTNAYNQGGYRTLPAGPAFKGRSYNTPLGTIPGTT